MPILAVCPYCREGKVRAPDTALGLSANCPRCYNCFTIVRSDEPVAPVAAAPPPPRPVSVTAEAPPTPAPVVPETVTATMPPPVKRAKAKPQPEPEPEPLDSPDEPSPKSHLTLPLALVAFTFAGLALFLSQLPLGRISCTAFAVIGLVVGVVGCLPSVRKGLLPASASLLNLVVLAVALLLPDWLGLGAWWPTGPADDSRTIKAINIDDGSATATEWVDASKSAWQRDGVRVFVRSASVGPVGLVGPNKQRDRTKAKYLRLQLHVNNEGVGRMVEFKGWGAAGPADAPRLTDSNGKVLALKQFEPSWQPEGRAKPVGLFPGKSADDILIFEVPAKNVEYLRLELPGSGIGDAEPVKLQIPRSWIVEL